MENTRTADRLHPGICGRILELRLAGPLRERLLELGLIPGRRIRRVCTAPAGSPIAYEAQGMVVALRTRDARNILVQEVDAPWTP